MSQLSSVKQRVAAAVHKTSYLAALVALAIATASIAYGLTNDDLLTAVGALLLAPSVVLLYRIGSREHDASHDARRKQAN